MSAECGVPTYRGQGGIWRSYRWQEYACQDAFERNPDGVIDFHELRRARVMECQPHAGHRRLADYQARHPYIRIVTQNTDGMHQRAGSVDVLELHGSLWRVRCPAHGVTDDTSAARYSSRHCPLCGTCFRPDITWFGDDLDPKSFASAQDLISACDLIVVIGCSGIVYPANTLILEAIKNGKKSVEINTEETEFTNLVSESIRMPAKWALTSRFSL